MDVDRSNSPTKGPAGFFTGDVWFTAVIDQDGPSPLRVSAIRFTPGARTAWHSHALGQTLYVTEGLGLVQARGGDVVELNSGDVAYAPPDEWHWHGAGPESFMTHLSIIQGAVDGDTPETAWGAHVSESEYRGME